jgi:predicted amidohydrolase
LTQIACRQLAPVLGDLEANIRLTLDAITGSVAAGAKLVVVPELALSGYMFTSTDEARLVSITPEHSVFAQWADAVRDAGAVVVGGFAELGDDGNVYNSAAIVDGTGVLGVYRKIHLWDKEKLVFTPGDVAPRVFETPVGKLGVLICFDLEFPEMTRTLALAGAELIVAPTNWPLEDVPDGERVPEVTVGMAAAYSNRVGIAACDRTGVERGQDWNGASSIINERGWVVATVDGDGVATADLDLALSHDKSLSALVDMFGDRRPDLYGAITVPKA